MMLATFPSDNIDLAEAELSGCSRLLGRRRPVAKAGADHFNIQKPALAKPRGGQALQRELQPRRRVWPCFGSLAELLEASFRWFGGRQLRQGEATANFDRTGPLLAVSYYLDCSSIFHRGRGRASAGHMECGQAHMGLCSRVVVGPVGKV